MSDHPAKKGSNGFDLNQNLAEDSSAAENVSPSDPSNSSSEETSTPAVTVTEASTTPPTSYLSTPTVSVTEASTVALTSDLSSLPSPSPQGKASSAISLEDDTENDQTILDLNTLLTNLAPLANLDESTISKLVTNIEELAKLSLEPKVAEQPTETSTTNATLDNDTLLLSCNSLVDITTRFQEYEYDEKLGGVICCVCSTENSSNVLFDYSSDLENDFRGKIKTKKFSNLKQILKKHLQTKSHLKSLEVATSKANIQYKEDSRNKIVALRILRIAYFLLKNGRPDTDFTALVYLHTVNGSDVGDINHSHNYVPKFLKHLANILENKLKSHLSSRLEQTGHLPPTKVVADKATWQHQTRQLIGVVTIVPGSDQPLQALMLGTPVVKSRNGPGVTENITSVTDKFITSSQYRGGSYDGQYFHLGVHTLLDAHYGVKSHHDVDPMHRAGTQDLKLRKLTSSA